MTVHPGPLLSAALLFGAFSFAAAVALVAVQQIRGQDVPWPVALFLFGLSAYATSFLSRGEWDVLVPLALGVAISLAASRWLRSFTVGGQFFLITNALLVIFGLAWGAWFIATIPVSSLTRGLLYAGYPLLLFSVPAGLVKTIEQWEVLCRKTWLRPRTPLAPAPRHHYPKVSFHVPAYAEPPEVVMATLDALAQMCYPNFEVLVVDNNTPHPRLWRPVEAHCQRLGARFRFFHLDRLSGAKAGALNFALRQTAPDAELVAVIDSDYHAAPDFLEALVGYFDDPQVGFVQTPHDYRAWQDSVYQRMCYWEYRGFFHTTMVSLNERGAGLTVGTMCLIRRRALEEAGGWAEWCNTEDSELAIRIHALGYSSVYVTTTYGRGLIPETFDGYKCQRFRWTYGPVQELKRHFPLFLPRPLCRSSALAPIQKIHHLNHGLEHINLAFELLMLPIGLGLVGSMLVHGEVIPVPLALFVAATVSLLAGVVYWLLVYRHVLRCSLWDTVGAFIASRALSHTRAVASCWCLVTSRMPWHRTNKFRAAPAGLAAFDAAKTELVLGLGALSCAIGGFLVLPRPGLLLMLEIGAAMQSLTYLAAPTLAFLAEGDVRSRQLVPAPQVVEAVAVPVDSQNYPDLAAGPRH